MAHSTFSLSWDLHKNNICNGLSSLQQNGEFVDMTLAADGHHVKVHKMIMALASPYIKDLIASADCPHPVIFLNKISNATLSAILEYIYTGEVLVSIDNLSELIDAARELHLKGLEDMDIHNLVNKQNTTQVESVTSGEQFNSPSIDDEICYFEVTDDSKVNRISQNSNFTIIDDGVQEDTVSLNADNDNDNEMEQDDDISEEHMEEKPNILSCVKTVNITNVPTDQTPSTMQYTVSNQGSLQMILNRYVYYLKHCNRNQSRQWRCVDYLNTTKCPAIVFTNKDEVVVQRISAHTHPFHDKKILKKVYAGAVFTALHEAELQGQSIKSKNNDKNDE